MTKAGLRVTGAVANGSPHDYPVFKGGVPQDAAYCVKSSLTTLGFAHKLNCAVHHFINTL